MLASDGDGAAAVGEASLPVQRGTFPSTFVARGRAVPAKPPLKAVPVPSIPSATPKNADPAGVQEGVPPCTAATDAVLTARFARFDTNQDGVLGKDEVAVLMSEMGFAADHGYITALITKFDQNADGVLECHEFAPLFDFLRSAQADEA